MRVLKLCMKASAVFAASLLVWYAGCCTFDEVLREWRNWRWRQEQIRRGDDPHLLDDWRRMRWVDTAVDLSTGVPQICLQYAFWGRNFPSKDIPDRAFFSVRTAYDKGAAAVLDWEVSQADVGIYSALGTKGTIPCPCGVMVCRCGAEKSIVFVEGLGHSPPETVYLMRIFFYPAGSEWDKDKEASYRYYREQIKGTVSKETEAGFKALQDKWTKKATLAIHQTSHFYAFISDGPD